MGEKDIAEKILEDYPDVFADIVRKRYCGEDPGRLPGRLRRYCERFPL